MVGDNSGHAEQCNQGCGADGQTVCKPQLVRSVDIDIFAGGQSDFSLVGIVNRGSIGSIRDDVSSAFPHR